MERPSLEETVELAGHCLHRLDRASDEGSLHLADGVIDRVTGSFVEDLEAEDLGSRHRAVFVGTREGDVERQDLIAVPGGRQFVHRADAVHLDVVHRVDGRTYAVLRAFGSHLA